jgi:hypothetical protein
LSADALDVLPRTPPILPPTSNASDVLLQITRPEPECNTAFLWFGNHPLAGGQLAPWLALIQVEQQRTGVECGGTKVLELPGKGKMKSPGSHDPGLELAFS